MARKVLITILRDLPGFWEDCVQRIRGALLSARPLGSDSPEIRVIAVHEWVGSQSYVDTIECVICHPTPGVLDSLNSLATKARDLLIVFVSGGEGRGWNAYPFTSEDRVIWFSGVYGRESQFEFWLKDWIMRGLSEASFLETRQALFSGKAGVGITAERLQRRLLSILMLLEGYQAVTEQISNPSDDNGAKLRKQIQGQLVRSLAQVWNANQLPEELSKDAALIYGAANNWDGATKTSKTILMTLLRDFILSIGAHGAYAPAMNEAVHRLLSGGHPISVIDRTVAEWRRRLSDLCGLLRELGSEGEEAR